MYISPILAVLIQIECILLSGVDERVTKADAETICAFHEGWLVDMDEGRGDDDDECDDDDHDD